MGKLSRYSFNVAGISYYEDSVLSLCSDNDEYDSSKKYLLDNYMDGDRVYRYEFSIQRTQLIPDPDNKYDPDAIKVIMDGELIGYVPKTKCQNVKEILGSKTIKTIRGEITGGDYKVVTDESVERDEAPYSATVDIIFYNDVADALLDELPDPARRSQPARDVSKPKKALHTFLLTLICIIGALGIAALLIFVFKIV